VKWIAGHLRHVQILMDSAWCFRLLTDDTTSHWFELQLICPVLRWTATITTKQMWRQWRIKKFWKGLGRAEDNVSARRHFMSDSSQMHTTSYMTFILENAAFWKNRGGAALTATVWRAWSLTSWLQRNTAINFLLIALHVSVSHRRVADIYDCVFVVYIGTPCVERASTKCGSATLSDTARPSRTNQPALSSTT